MSTFSLPNTTKSYQPKPSKANYIEPGKRSVSTACPTIVVDKNGSVKMVVGGSGALRITSGVPMVRNLVLFNLNVRPFEKNKALRRQKYVPPTLLFLNI
jgi:gamma-glutamyltranspeptidase